MGFPGSSAGKESSFKAGDPVSVPGSGRSPGEENGSSGSVSCLVAVLCRWIGPRG